MHTAWLEGNLLLALLTRRLEGIPGQGRVKTKPGRLKIPLKWVQIPQRQPSQAQAIQALAPKEGATPILADSLADGLHLVEEGGEFVDGRITPRGLHPVIA